MSDLQYLQMLCDGLKLHRNYLADYLIREQKLAEDQHITKKEFLNRVYNVIEDFKLIRDNKSLESLDISAQLILTSLGKYDYNEINKDFTLLSEAFHQAFDFEQIDEPQVFDLQEWAIEVQQAKKEKEAIYTSKDLEKIWFKVGLLFATGEINELLSMFKSCTQIAKFKYGDNWKSYRPYISESKSKTNLNRKNIFSDQLKINKLTQYCTHNNLPICSDFLK